MQIRFFSSFKLTDKHRIQHKEKENVSNVNREGERKKKKTMIWNRFSQPTVLFKCVHTKRKPTYENSPNC